MKTVILYILIVTVLLQINENEKLNKKVRDMQEKIDLLCKKTGNEDMATDFVSGDLKDYLKKVKKESGEVKAVKVLRKKTSLSLLEAKKYIDSL